MNNSNTPDNSAKPSEDTSAVVVNSVDPGAETASNDGVDVEPKKDAVVQSQPDSTR
jgi:hypothetical protein